MQARSEVRQLVVTDDHAAFRTIVREVAEPMGWQVHECRHGRELATLLEGGLVPDLILLDVHMPESDGIETIDLLIAHHKAVPIAVISGADPTLHDAASALARMKGLRVVATVRKPVSVQGLRDLLGSN
jgi:CheY-like chemotaxis protein